MSTCEDGLRISRESFRGYCRSARVDSGLRWDETAPKEDDSRWLAISATGPTTYKRHDGGSGAGVKVLALFLGIAVGVLVIVAAVLIKMTDDARDEVNAPATAAPAAHDQLGTRPAPSACRCRASQE